MGTKFDMTNRGRLSYYLGIKVNQRMGYIELKDEAYAERDDCKSAKYPMKLMVQIDKDEVGKPVNPSHFKSLVEGLHYLVHT